MHQWLVNTFIVINTLKYANKNKSFKMQVNVKEKRLQKSITVNVCYQIAVKNKIL